MTTASKITMVRVALIPAFMALLLLGLNIPAFVVFVIASLTDFADGYVARHYNQVSNFGKFVDPLADKLLVIAAMTILCEQGRFASWALMVVLTREFAVSGLRMIAAEGGLVIAAAWSGKIKTASTMVGLCVMMVITRSSVIDLLVMLLILITTLVSGIEYFIKNWHVFGFGSKTE